jgi:hypothetical protein
MKYELHWGLNHYLQSRMNKTVITIFYNLLLAVFEGYCQSLPLYYPDKPGHVSVDDYNAGKTILREAHSQMQKAKDGIVSIDYWNYAVAYSRMGQPADSIYYFLSKSNSTNKKDFCELLNKAYIPHFNGLENTPFYKLLGYRFESLVTECMQCKELSSNEVINIDEYARKGNYDNVIVIELIEINKRDQMYRLPYDVDLQTPLDYENQKRIEAIISKYGYPGRSLVGEKYESVAWAVIQHSDLVFQEKYLPTIHQAVINNELHETPLKMLLDRIYTIKNGVQIFGSQIGVQFADERIITEVKAKYNIK